MHYEDIKLDPAPGCGRFHGSRECDCPRPWRIIKSKNDPAYPWLVSRYTNDFRYEPVMRCSNFESATRLVAALVWLAKQQNAASSVVLKGNPYVG